MKKILFCMFLLLFLAPLPARGSDDLETLIYQLRGASPFAQFKIVERIGDLGTAEAIDALIGLLSDEELRWMAVRQLAIFRTAAVPPLLEVLDKAYDPVGSGTGAVARDADKVDADRDGHVSQALPPRGPIQLRRLQQ